MSINLVRSVIFFVQGDGSSTVFSVDLSSAPVSLLPDTNGSSASSIGVTQRGFDFRVSPAVAVQSVSVAGGISATAALSRSILTVTFAAAPSASGTTEVFAVLAF